MANTKKDLENILNKSKLEIYDLEYIDDSFDILLNRKENEYIKKIWPKLINKIDWENIYKYSGKFSPKENTIKSFQIFLDLGDLYIEEQNFKKSVDIYELGLKNLENWKKNNEINLYYIVYKRKFVVSYATPKTFLLVTEYNANLDNKKKADKAFQKLKSISDELKNIEKSFYLLNSDIQLQIRKRYPKHLIYVYQSLQTSNQFLQDKKESYVWAKKLYEETKSLPKNRDNISDMFEAHYTMIIASIGVNRLQVANYHINEFKNYSLRLVENVNGVKDVASFSSFMLPFMLHAGLYYEAEELLNFVENYLDFNQQIFGNFQRDSFFYTMGRIKLKNKEYKKAISSFEIASKEFMNNPSASLELNYSALSSLMLLEAYLMNNDLDKFKKHFFNLTNSYPENYRSFSETKPSKYFYIPSDIAMSQVFSVIKYLKKKDIQLKKNEAKEIISLLKDEFKEYTPGEESKIEMIKYAVKIASEIFDANNDSTVKFIKNLKDEIQQEYSNAFFNSNLSPNHKIDDLISGLLNVSYKAENEKIFSSNYQLIQIVSNSVTSRDLRKSFNKKKFKEIKHRKLIDEYQKLQILKNSIYISDEFSSFKKKELKDLNAQSFNSFERSSKIDKKILEIEKKIKSEIPEYFSKIKPTGSKLSTIKTKLNNKDLFLEYFFFENKTYVIIVTNKNYKILKLNLKKDDLERLAQNIKQSLTIDENGNLNKYNVKSSFELYSKIFKPIEKFLNNKSNIILAPNSFLNFIPMHILPTSEKNNCLDCSRISWLKDKYNFTYIPNSEFFTLKKKPLLNFSKLLSNKKPFYLGIGNPDLEPDIENLRAKNKNQDLKVITSMLRGNNFIKDTSEIGNIYTSVIGSEEEIKKISEILKPLKSDLLLKSEANEKKLKSMSLQDYKIIHFATHGELAGYIKGKNEPFLVLTPPKIGTEENDGLLNLSEIMSLELNANLVILSACNTASNNIREAEGFTGLARAFLYAGSNSVMVSNWYIETIAAQKLTTNFIQNLREKNINNSEALTISMNKLSQDPQTSHPFYWGPFVIVGLIDNLKINS